MIETNSIALPDPLAPDADGCVGRDLPCRCCGYNLRGVLAAGDCPECGAAVELAARRDDLAFASPQWVATLARGLRWVWVAAVLMFLSWIAGVVAPNVGLPGWSQSLRYATMLVWIGLAYGVWHVTTPQPGAEHAPTRTAHAGGTTRWAIIAATGFGLAASALPGVAPPVIVTIAAELTWLVATVSMFLYLGYLANRVPSARLAKSAYVVAIGWGLQSLLSIAILAVFLAGALPPPPGTMWPVIVLIIWAAVTLVVWIGTLLLIHRFKAALTRAAAEAAANWPAAATSGGTTATETRG